MYILIIPIYLTMMPILENIKEEESELEGPTPPHLSPSSRVFTSRGAEIHILQHETKPNQSTPPKNR